MREFIAIIVAEEISVLIIIHTSFIKNALSSGTKFNASRKPIQSYPRISTTEINATDRGRARTIQRG